MSATVIDTLLLEIGIKDQFSSQTKKVESSLEKIEKLEAKRNKAVKKSAQEQEKATKEIINQNKKAEESIKSLCQTYEHFEKILQSVAATVMSALGVEFVHQVAKANVELDNLSQNMGISRQDLQAWQGVAKMTGGSTEGITSSINALSNSLTRFKLMGDASSLPFFNTLGVAPFDVATGKMKDLNQILIELSASIQGMERGTAKSLINGLGIDDGTFNLLMSGPAEVKRLLAQQNKIARVNDRDIENSRKLLRSVGMLQSQFEALRVKITSAVTPVMTKLADLAIKFVDYLSQNEETLKNVLKTVSVVIGASLVPVLLTAVGAALSLAASLLPTALAISVVAGGLALLYDDYNTWAKGGKSLFDWKEFKTWFDESDFSVRNFAQSILYLLTGYKDWSNFVANAKDWLKIKGFIDENGSFSIEGLKRGFKRMMADLLEFLMPLFSKLGDIVGALLTLNFDKAGHLWEDLRTDLKNGFDEFTEAASDRLSGSVDVARGKEPRKSKGGKFNGFGEEIDGYIKEASDRYGVDHAMLRGLVKMEDGWYGKDSKTGAVGVGQFTKGTWNDLAKTPEGRAIGMTPITAENKGKANDPRRDNHINTLATALLARENAKILSRKGVEITGENLYMAHNIGAGGLIEALNGKASQATINAMRHNGMKEGQTPLEFIAWQKGNFLKHYGLANRIEGTTNRREALAQKETQLNDVPVSSYEEAQGAVKLSERGDAGKTREKSTPIQSENKGGFFSNLIEHFSKKSYSARWKENHETYMREKEGQTLSEKGEDKPENTASALSKATAGLQQFVTTLASMNGVLQSNGKYAASDMARTTMMNYAQPHTVNNNPKTDIVINGGVNVQSSASTIAGTASDAMIGLQQGVNIMSFNNGLS